MLALGAFRRDRMLDLQRDVAIAGFTNVETLVGVGLDAFAGFLQHFQHVPLGDALFCAAQQRECRVPLDLARLGRPNHRLVGCDQRYAELLQIVFDFRALVGEPADAVDGFADDGIEAPVWPPGFLQQVRDAAISRDVDIELLPSRAASSTVQLQARGFNIPEVVPDLHSGFED
ncbi:MAG TPA: hypothetical protein VFC19_26310 [Candidatus Limnocylindrales bacterium]|nr:hypothetical protein [Candidatus Limnocylindrales bacterium]